MGERLVDTFLFFNELDLLEIRLHALAPYVRKFVLAECPITHSGKPKPLFFQENKERFKDFPIEHLIVPITSGTSWVLEHYQREYLMKGIEDADPEEIILLSDMDEIPNMKGYEFGKEGAFKQKMYYYYLNIWTGTLWKGTIARKKKNIVKLNRVRNRRNGYPTIVFDGGWHFSTLGTTEQIIYKIESFAHIELDKPEFKDRIDDNRKNLQDPYNRGAANWGKRDYRLRLEMPNGPDWLLENKEKFAHLFYGDLNAP